VDGVSALFTEICSVENPAVLFQGKEQLRKLTYGLSIMLKKHNARHGNFSLTMTAEEAPRVRSQGSFFMIIYEINPKIIATGSYNDILRKENGLWKFSQRKIEFKTGREIYNVLQSWEIVFVRSHKSDFATCTVPMYSVCESRRIAVLLLDSR
jgi:hypothetical protein